MNAKIKRKAVYLVILLLNNNDNSRLARWYRPLRAMPFTHWARHADAQKSTRARHRPLHVCSYGAR